MNRSIPVGCCCRSWRRLLSGLAPPVGIVRDAAGPTGAAGCAPAAARRSCAAAAGGWWPTPGSSRPRVVAGRLAPAQADDQVPMNTSSEKPSTYAPRVETRFSAPEWGRSGVGEDPPRHAQQAQEVQHEEGPVEADHHQPEVHLSRASPRAGGRSSWGTSSRSRR